MTRFVIHIGPHKTGTTYLQKTLATLREPLFESGICFPSVWSAAPELPSHMKLVRAFRDGDLTLVKDQLQDILAQRPDCVVLSCEALSRLNHAQIVQLRQLVGSAPVQIVFYVRRSPERIPSLWQEEVKHGETGTLLEFVAREFTRRGAFSSWEIMVLDAFSAVFGRDQIKIVSYSHLSDTNIDIAEHFLASFLDLPDIRLPLIGRPNGSLSILDIEPIRALNSIHMRQGGARSADCRNWYLAHRDGLVPDTVLDAMRSNLGTICLDEHWPPLVLLPQDILARYAASLVPPWHPETLHELRGHDVTYVRQDYLLDPAVPKILDEIYDRYRGAR